MEINPTVCVSSRGEMTLYSGSWLCDHVILNKNGLGGIKNRFDYLLNLGNCISLALYLGSIYPVPQIHSKSKCSIPCTV